MQIFLIYYGLGQFRPSLQAMGSGAVSRPYWCAIIALSLNTAAYGSEILRGAMQGVPHGLIEAATRLRMSRALTLRLIVLPLALAPGNPELRQRDHPHDQGYVACLDRHADGGHRNRPGAHLANLSCRRGLRRAGAIYLALNFTIISALTALETRLTPIPGAAPEA